MKVQRLAGLLAVSLLLGACKAAASDEVVAADEVNMHFKTGESENEITHRTLEMLADSKVKMLDWCSILLTARCQDTQEYERRYEQLAKQIDVLNQQFMQHYSFVVEKGVCCMKVEDIPASVPEPYRLQLQWALQRQSPQEVVFAIDEVMKNWESALVSKTQWMSSRLVPILPELMDADKSKASSTELIDAWFQTSREQRRARMYASEGVINLFDYLGYLVDHVMTADYAGVGYVQKDEFRQKDHRWVLMGIYARLMADAYMNLLMADYIPDFQDNYKLVAAAAAFPLDYSDDDEFVDALHQELLDGYSFNESDQYTTAEEVRETVELKLENSMRLMKRAYNAQVRLLRESFALGVCDGLADEIELDELYEQKLSIIQMFYEQDMDTLRHKCDWYKTDDAEVQESDSPDAEENAAAVESEEEVTAAAAEPEEDVADADADSSEDGESSEVKPKSRLGVSEFMVPHFVCYSTPDEYLVDYTYRNASKSIRWCARSAFHLMCEHSIEMVVVAGHRGSNDDDSYFQFGYLMRCFDDAEYAWERYVDSLFHGSITNIR